MTVLFEVADNIATITLNRPEKLNAFNEKMINEIAGIWQRVRDDDAIHVAVLRAAGERAFCTGLNRKQPVRFEQRRQARHGTITRHSRHAGLSSRSAAHSHSPVRTEVTHDYRS